MSRLADDLVQTLFKADPILASLAGVHDRDADLPDLREPAARALAERLRRLAGIPRYLAAAAERHRAGVAATAQLDLPDRPDRR